MAEAKMQEMKTKSKGTMPVCVYKVGFENTPQTDKPTDKSFWDEGGQVPAHAKDAGKSGGGVSIDKSLDRMAEENKVYETF